MSRPEVTLLYGSDEFAIARRLKQFAADFPDPSSADLNITRLEARQAGEDELNNAVNALPFLAGKRLVLLGSPSARYTTAPARRKFEDFLVGVPETAHLVLYEVVGPRDEDKHWLVRWAKKHQAGLERFTLPQRGEMTGWIIAETRAQGGQMQPQAAALLAEMTGEDTRQAAQEIAKLLAYANFSRPVTAEDVAEVSVTTARQSVFDFVDALAAGQGRRAQSLLGRLLQDEEPFSLWGMVVRQYRLLLLARELLDEGVKPAQAAQALGVHPFVAEKACKQAGRFCMAELEGIYRRLLEIDEAVKTGRLAMDLALDLLVVELAG
jgi:DNA polymerase III subunit delta